MARVLADDIVLNYNGTNYYLVFVKSTIYDASGNNNGRLDPGETANLTSTLQNIGGVNFTNLTTTLQSSDPYITITDNSGYFGSLVVDSTKENTNDPYTVTISSSCPSGHNVQFRLIATDGSFIDTFEFSLVVGSYHYLVWNPDPIPASGQAINSTLMANGYTGNYTQNLLTEPTLDIYQAIFVCCGIYPDNYRIGATSPEATALVNYLNNGGRVYMEGGDVWYYDPQVGGYNFGSLFGLVGTADGTSDVGPVVGQTATFANGMYFNYSGENNYIDHLDATTGNVIFYDGNNSYNCGVAYNAGTYRTVGLSFELDGLVNASAPSTKTVLLDSIMHFFGIFPQGIEENTRSAVIRQGLRLYPNPFKLREGLRIQFAPLANTKASLKIYNTLGNCVKTITVNPSIKTNSIIWDGTDDYGRMLPAGVYFVNLNLDSKTLIERVVLVN